MFFAQAPSLKSGLRAFSLCSIFAQNAYAVSLEVKTSGGNSSSSILYGFMFEDINHSGDGGIYGQLLQNNGLQGSDPNLTAWASVGDATIAVDSENPLSSAIPHSLRLDVPKGATGSVGVTNTGYWGIPVDGSEFQTYFWIKGDLSSNITARLVGNGTGTEYASTSIPITSTSDNFTYIDASFATTKAPDGNVYYELSLDGESVAGSSLYFGLIQLFPTTYKNRYNGLQPRIANVLEAVKGSFLRFPGGNNLEGDSPADRWKWNETIGPVEDRPGREGDWTYYNTDGLGLAEYFYWCEDMGLEAVLGVWDGFSLESGGGTPITGDALTPYINDVLNELEYILGDTSTTYGALRASHGQSDPWPLTMVEIGNEDHLGGGCDSYPDRFSAFYDAIHAAYPDLTIIASTAESSCLPSSIPNGTWLDYHDYNSPDGLVGQFDYFDNLDRATPYFIGEYAQTGADIPIMQGSVAEAVFMIGFERNSDLVKMASYAPLLQLVNSTQWTPNLIPFTQSPDVVVETSSYFVQQMFSTNRGDTIKEVTSDAAFGPVYWVASSTSNNYFVKLANYGSDVQDVSVAISGMTTAKLTVVGDNDPNASNTDTETPITPVDSTLSTSNGTFTFTLPAWSVAVLAAS
ncbi:Arabinosidase A [Penicillium hispanicum]|uniref:Arabinosidase A n=1 Tax=Penicillium hispanicum TaxID=1080232 RepID=UPI0025423B55|nr:Arabinosidase A [Penicillium hispanicum]KAJ5593923.1 Arabinosidase A [Penicillium hispanicum]